VISAHRSQVVDSSVSCRCAASWRWSLAHSESNRAARLLGDTCEIRRSHVANGYALPRGTSAGRLRIAGPSGRTISRRARRAPLLSRAVAVQSAPDSVGSHWPQVPHALGPYEHREPLGDGGGAEQCQHSPTPPMRGQCPMQLALDDHRIEHVATIVYGTIASIVRAVSRFDRYHGTVVTAMASITDQASSIAGVLAP